MRLALIYYPFLVEGLAAPLNLMSIAAYLTEYMGFKDTRIIDMGFEDPMEAISRFKPDLVGVSAMTQSYGRMITLSAKIKERFNLPVIIGGVHITVMPNSLNRAFDLGVVGEGEETMLELLRLFEGAGGFPQEKLKDIKGVVYHTDGGPRFSGPRPPIDPLDRIPIPERGLMNEHYLKPHLICWGEEGYAKTADMMTSRGCPYKCSFCSSSQYWDRFRTHGTERIFEEIRLLYERYGIERISIVDDLFVFNKKRLSDLKDKLKENKMLGEVNFNCQARVNIIDEEMCGLLRELNCTSLNFGMESGSDRILKTMNKTGVTVEAIKSATKTCIRHGLHVSGGTIMGSPYESLEDMQATVDLLGWLAKEGADINWLYVMTPYPGTKIWEIALERGKVSDDLDWENTQLNIADTQNPLLLDKDVPLEEYRKKWLAATQQIEKMRKPRSRLKRLFLRLRYEPRKALKESILEPKKAAKYLVRTLKI